MAVNVSKRAFKSRLIPAEHSVLKDYEEYMELSRVNCDAVGSTCGDSFSTVAVSPLSQDATHQSGSPKWNYNGDFFVRVWGGVLQDFRFRGFGFRVLGLGVWC